MFLSSLKLICWLAHARFGNDCELKKLMMSRCPVKEPGDVLKELILHFRSVWEVPLSSGRKEIGGTSGLLQAHGTGRPCGTIRIQANTSRASQVPHPSNCSES